MASRLPVLGATLLTTAAIASGMVGAAAAAPSSSEHAQRDAGGHRMLWVTQCSKWNYDVIAGVTRCTSSTRAKMKVRPAGTAGQWQVFKAGKWSWIPYELSHGTLVYSHALDLSHGGSWPTFSRSGPLHPGEYRPLPGAFPQDELAGGAPPSSTSGGGASASVRIGNPYRKDPALSRDGRYVAYVSGQETSTPQIRRWDTVTGADELVTVNMSGAESVGKSYYPRISADGSIVAFISDAGDLVPGDVPVTPTEDDEQTAMARDVFVRDMSSGVTRLANFMRAGAPVGSRHDDLVMSADGRYVAFTWSNPNSWMTGVYRSDLRTGSTVRVDPPNLFSPSDPSGGTGATSISDSGQLIGYQMWWPQSAVGLECVVTNMAMGRTVNLSVMPSGQPYPGQCRGPFVSGDGSAAYLYAALVENPGPLCDPRCRTDEYVADVATGALTSLDGVQVPGWDTPLSIDAMSPTGRYVAGDGYISGDCAVTLDACHDWKAATVSFVVDRVTGRSAFLRMPLFGPGALNTSDTYRAPGPVIPKPGLDYRTNHLFERVAGISADGQTILLKSVLEDPANGTQASDLIPVVVRVNWSSVGIR